MRTGVVAAAIACACIARLGVSAASAPTQPTFASPVTVATYTTPTGHAELEDLGASDLNGDGRTDILAVRMEFDVPAPTPVAVYAADRTGHFSDATSSLFDGAAPAPVSARRIVFADFNGDGRPDAFIADTGTDAPPFPGWPNSLILSAPGGKLVDASANLPRAPDFTHCAAAADVDGNGTIDLYAGNLPVPSGSHVPPQILLNDGAAHFRVAADALPANMRDESTPHWDGCGFADVNGDRAPDLVLVGSPGNANRLLLNDGHGTFRDSPTPLPEKPWGTANSDGLVVTPLDLNSDNHVDLLLAYTRNDPFYVGTRIQVLVNNGDGTFRDETDSRLPQTDDSGEWPLRIEVADLNGDGKPDLGISKWWYPADRPVFFLNRGDGTFEPFAPAALSGIPPDFVFLDANGDGRTDIYSGEPSGTETHRLSLQVAPTVAPKPKPKPKRKPVPKCKRKPRPRGCR